METLYLELQISYFRLSCRACFDIYLREIKLLTKQGVVFCVIFGDVFQIRIPSNYGLIKKKKKNATKNVRNSELYETRMYENRGLPVL